MMEFLSHSQIGIYLVDAPWPCPSQMPHQGSTTCRDPARFGNEFAPLSQSAVQQWLRSSLHNNASDCIKNRKINFKEQSNLKDMHEVNIQDNTTTILLDKTQNMNNLYYLTRIKEVIDYLHWCCFLPHNAT